MDSTGAQFRGLSGLSTPTRPGRQVWVGSLGNLGSVLKFVAHNILKWGADVQGMCGRVAT